MSACTSLETAAAATAAEALAAAALARADAASKARRAGEDTVSVVVLVDFRADSLLLFDHAVRAVRADNPGGLSSSRLMLAGMKLCFKLSRTAIPRAAFDEALSCKAC
jgi:hypothetical protein